MTTRRGSVGASRGRTRGPSRRGRGERGAVLVEFALVVVLLFFVLYGIIAYGMAIALRQSMGQAAGEAVRAAVVFPGDNIAKTEEAVRIGADVTKTLAREEPSRNMALAACADGTADCTEAIYGYSTIKAAVVPCPTGSGDCVSVTYEYDYKDGAIVPGGPFGVALPNTLTATAMGQLVP